VIDVRRQVRIRIAIIERLGEEDIVDRLRGRLDTS